MDITREEARESLEAVEEVQRRARRALAHGGGPYYMMLWGVIWFVGYLGNQFLSDKASGILWMVLSGLGMLASVAVGAWISRQVRRKLHDYRIGLFWLALLLYAGLTMWAAKPSSGEAGSFIVTLFIMFGYVVMGLWMWGPLGWIRIGVTAVATVAYLWVPGYFDLIMAILGGGTLFFSGFYILQNWR
jgi:hypothetical protein